MDGVRICIIESVEITNLASTRSWNSPTIDVIFVLARICVLGGKLDRHVHRAQHGLTEVVEAMDEMFEAVRRRQVIAIDRRMASFSVLHGVFHAD